MIREAALKTKSATVGFTTKTAVNSSPEMVRKTSLAVARAKEGDREALRFLYVSYSHNIYGYVRSIVRDDHEAEDVTQHVFAKLMTTIGKYDDRGVPFFAWLLRMARNVAIDHLRANRLTPIENLPESGTESDSDIDQVHTVREALAALPEEQREVVVLRHVIGLTPGEIADRLGRTESSIHGLHHRGRRALQRELMALETSPSTRPVEQSRSRRRVGLAGRRVPDSAAAAKAAAGSRTKDLRPPQRLDRTRNRGRQRTWHYSISVPSLAQSRSALVNNMPDSAFLDTENQFRGAALGPTAAGIEFELYTIKEIPRSEKVAALIEERYRGPRRVVDATAGRLDRHRNRADAGPSCASSRTGPTWRGSWSGPPATSRRRCFRAWPRTPASSCSTASSGPAATGEAQRRVRRHRGRPARSAGHRAAGRGSASLTRA